MGRCCRFFARLAGIVGAKGKKRFGYALGNILLVAFTAAVFLYGFWFFGNHDAILKDNGTAVWLLLWIVTPVVMLSGLISFLEGVVAQAVTLVCALLGVVLPGDRGWNLGAFFVALLSLAALVVFVVLVVCGTLFG